MEQPRSSDDPLVSRLRAAGCVWAEDEAALLRAATDDPVDLEDLVRRRVGGVPLEVLVGWAGFDGLRVGVHAGVFVPRQRTVLLVRTAASLVSVAGPVIVDLCCGTGAIGLALVGRLPGAELHAADVEPSAVRCARSNLNGIGAVHAGDLFEALPPSLQGRIDVLAVNAPYVPTDDIAMMPPEARDHEPLVALDGGADGLDIQRRVAAGAAEWLAPQGFLVIETSRRQASQTAAMLAEAGLHPRRWTDDELGATVVSAARRP